MLKLSLFSISSLLCLNLGWAQTSVPTPTPPAGPILNSPSPNIPPITITTTPASTSPNSADASKGAPTDSILNLVGAVSGGKGKYEEYLSICRENLFDTPVYFSETVQQQRIDDLKEKIKSSKNSTTFKLKLLKEYIDQKKALETEQQYAGIKAERSDERVSKIADALVAWSRQEINRAETTLSKLVIDNPKDAEALLYLAEIYTANQKYFEAASAYFDLVKLTKESFDLQLCEIHTLDAQPKEAEKFCKKANQALPENPYPFIYLGISEREKLNLNLAVIHFKNSLKRQQTEMAYVCVGEIFFIKENFSVAIEAFKRALKISPKSSRAIQALAWAQIKDKKTLDALESFKSACKLNRNVAVDLRKAYKILNEEKSAHARLFAEYAQNCQ